jgi:hypothetical protein
MVRIASDFRRQRRMAGKTMDMAEQDQKAAAWREIETQAPHLHRETLDVAAILAFRSGPLA